MSCKPVVLRQRAEQDVIEALDRYREEAGEAVALGFVQAIEDAFVQLAQQPGSGSPRYALALDLPGLRCWPIRQFPYLIFYLEQAGQIDVWRVLHQHCDIPAWLQEP